MELHTREIHRKFLNQLCRTCGKKIWPKNDAKSGKNRAKKCTDLSFDILLIFAISISMDSMTAHSSVICKTCTSKISNTKKHQSESALQAARKCANDSNSVWMEFDETLEIKDCTVCQQFIELVYPISSKAHKRKFQQSQQNMSSGNATELVTKGEGTVISSSERKLRANAALGLKKNFPLHPSIFSAIVKLKRISIPNSLHSRKMGKRGKHKDHPDLFDRHIYPTITDLANSSSSSSSNDITVLKNNKPGNDLDNRQRDNDNPNNTTSSFSASKHIRTIEKDNMDFNPGFFQEKTHLKENELPLGMTIPSTVAHGKQADILNPSLDPITEEYKLLDHIEIDVADEPMDDEHFSHGGTGNNLSDVFLNENDDFNDSEKIDGVSEVEINSSDKLQQNSKTFQGQTTESMECIESLSTEIAERMKFSCSKASCDFETISCTSYEEHLISCFEELENMSETSERKRNLCIKSVFDYHLKNSTQATPKFVDFFNKICTNNSSKTVTYIQETSLASFTTTSKTTKFKDSDIYALEPNSHRSVGKVSKDFSRSSSDDDQNQSQCILNLNESTMPIVLGDCLFFPNKYFLKEKISMQNAQNIQDQISCANLPQGTQDGLKETIGEKTESLHAVSDCANGDTPADSSGLINYNEVTTGEQGESLSIPSHSSAEGERASLQICHHCKMMPEKCSCPDKCHSEPSIKNVGNKTIVSTPSKFGSNSSNNIPFKKVEINSDQNHGYERISSISQDHCSEKFAKYKEIITRLGTPIVVPNNGTLNLLNVNQNSDCNKHTRYNEILINSPQARNCSIGPKNVVQTTNMTAHSEQKQLDDGLNNPSVLKNNIDMPDMRTATSTITNENNDNKPSYNNERGQGSSLDEKDETDSPFKCHICESRTFRSKLRLQIHLRWHSGERPYQCNNCGGKFIDKEGLSKHTRRHAGVRPFQCMKCCRRFVTSQLLDHHIKMHIAGPFACSECNKSFYSNQYLTAHLKSHKEEKPYCTSCDESFQSRGLFFRHQLNVHKGQSLLACDKCGRRFNHQRDFRLHMNRHEVKSKTKEKKTQYECTECTESFTFKYNLEGHVKKIHNGVMSYKCKECGKSYSDESYFNSHVKRHRGEIRSLCCHCGKGFDRPARLARHLKTHEKAEERMTAYAKALKTCRECGKKVTSLKSHMIIHSTEREMVICNVCGKCLKSKRILEGHMTIHEGEKPIKCTMCTKSFLFPSHLRVHMRGHTGERPFLCNVCGLGFKAGFQLMKHKKIHMDDRKKFECNECGKNLCSKYAFTAHMRKHNGETPFKCDKCDKAYTSKSSLHTHYNLIHSKIQNAETFDNLIQDT